MVVLRGTPWVLGQGRMELHIGYDIPQVEDQASLPDWEGGSSGHLLQRSDQTVLDEVMGASDDNVVAVEGRVHGSDHAACYHSNGRVVVGKEPMMAGGHVVHYAFRVMGDTELFLEVVDGMDNRLACNGVVVKGAERTDETSQSSLICETEKV